MGIFFECTGIKVVTPEFPEDSHDYFLTQDWLTVPRCWVGESDISFKQKCRGLAKRSLRLADFPKREKVNMAFRLPNTTFFFAEIIIL
ncbi:MAG: hypothetical protein CMM67_09475 [Rhodospirillaceae bacterium]|nr:hypothetical protein [Rhodospirillaceae bacterium]OUT76954.1 MAG: hypothetical protein CBB83_09655 [Rhodospirillaceae bacterium TMED23]